MAVADLVRDESRDDRSSLIPDEQLFTVIQILMSFFYPPIAVFLERGVGFDFLISLILTLFFWLPGVVYALYIVLTYEDRFGPAHSFQHRKRRTNRDHERGDTTLSQIFAPGNAGEAHRPAKPRGASTSRYDGPDSDADSSSGTDDAEHRWTKAGNGRNAALNVTGNR